MEMSWNLKVLVSKKIDKNNITIKVLEFVDLLLSFYILR